MKSRIQISNTTSNPPDAFHKLKGIRPVAYDGPTDNGHQFSIQKMTAVDSVDIENLQHAVMPNKLTFAHNSLGDLILHVENDSHDVRWAVLAIVISIASALLAQDVLKEFTRRFAELWPH